VRKLVFAIGLAVFVLGLTACPNEVDLGFIDEAPSLAAIWAEHFPLGNIISPGYSSARMSMLARHFDILTAENHMKPDTVQPNPGSFNFGPGQSLISDARRAGIGRFHGHTLVWHSQSPWHLNQQFANGPPIGRDAAIANLRNHIDGTMRAFPTVESWDVLNEIFAGTIGGDGSNVTVANWRNFLRNFPGGTQGTPWARAIGVFPHEGRPGAVGGRDPNRYCYIWISFMQARRTAYAMGRPDMVLYYNDYNEEQPGKRNAIFYMVREMNEEFARRFPGGQYGSTRLIDAIGMQAHYHRGDILGDAPARFPWGPNSLANIRAAIERFASLDVYVSITELDVTVGDTRAGPLTPLQQREQAFMYAQIFQIFRDNAGSLRRVSIWGLDDPASWRHEGSPLLFDRNSRPKEAFWAVADPDAFVNPETGARRSDAEINAFLANPAASGRIPQNAWLSGRPR